MTELSTTLRAPLPVFRAAVFALVGTVLGVSAHHLVAEGPAPWRQSTSAVAVLFAVGLAGARRPRSLISVVAVCGVAQCALHLWLTTAHAHAAPATAMSAHAHHGTDAHTTWHERLHDSLAMTTVHAASAVLVAVLLHQADTVCWSVARGLTAAVDAVRTRMATVWTLLGERPAPAPYQLPAVIQAWLQRPPLKEAVLADVVVRRGPPQAGTPLAI
ncbi:hypothetical protein GCM10010313_78620 [Streptomyces violarus]|uniref:Uncharacterized protein n=1 Tax=Streptomyces violarus TaxID=67380 RepID=A0A7W4ZSH9_9ACTN|nr:MULTISPECIES: hypothetical protein [Streptomyces]MBB3077661.1 hypothetical protein [Streptomyces violarus]WRU00148.1 hypothetical protein VJ737_21700 [Streptomyces sp. CGMCC 4.1772]GHD33248.1 hypothetical protein GCM10010313_78620 [Streptomyces violarus]